MVCPFLLADLAAIHRLADLEGQSGYVDNGEEEDWRDNYSDDEQRASDPASTGRYLTDDAAGDNKRRSKKTNESADAAETKAPARAPPKKKVYDPSLNPYKPKVQDIDSDAFMSSLLDGVGTDSSAALRKSLPRPASTSSLSSLSRKRRKAEPDDLSASLSAARFSSFATAAPGSSSSLPPTSDPGQVLTSSDGMDAAAWPAKADANEDGAGYEMDVDYSVPETDVARADVKEEADAEELLIKPLAAQAAKPRAPRQLVNVNATKRAQTAKVEPVADAPKAAPKGMDWMAATEGIAVSAEILGDLPAEEDLIAPTIRGVKAKAAAAAAAASAPVTSRIDAFEDDHSLRFFWLDYKEVNGVVSLIGKVLDRKTGAHVSACLTVNGLERNLYVLPRPKWAGRSAESLEAEADGMRAVTLLLKLAQTCTGSADADQLQSEIEEEQNLHDEIHEEIEALCKRNDISDVVSKTVTRDYAFEVKDVPIGKSRYLKVKYPFTCASLPVRSGSAC
jgi:DNA polymerase alpha subunit A